MTVYRTSASEPIPLLLSQRVLHLFWVAVGAFAPIQPAAFLFACAQAAEPPVHTFFRCLSDSSSLTAPALTASCATHDLLSALLAFEAFSGFCVCTLLGVHMHFQPVAISEGLEIRNQTKAQVIGKVKHCVSAFAGSRSLICRQAWDARGELKFAAQRERR